MKNLIFSLIIFLSVPLSAFAQNPPGFGIGQDTIINQNQPPPNFPGVNDNNGIVPEYRNPTPINTSILNERQNQPPKNVNFFDNIVPASLFEGKPLTILLNQIFYFGLLVAVILAIVMIVRGGIQYMTTDAIDSKSGAKKRIQAALGGLVLAFSSILILNTINPSLTNLNIELQRVDIIGSSGYGTTLNNAGITSGTRTDPMTGQPIDQTPGDTSSVVKGDFSTVTADNLRSYLGSNYSDADVQAFVDAGKQYGIDPRFLASISKFETGNGTSKAFTDGRNNAMGTSNSVGPIGFSSVRDSIFTQTNNLVKSNGYYSKANTIQQIGDIYSPSVNPETGKPYQNDINGTNHSWAGSVSSNYAEMTKRND